MENTTKSKLKLSSIVEKKYKCPSCFYSSDNLHIVRQHIITHYVKPEVCPYCQEVPTTKYHRRSLYRKDISRFIAKEGSVVFSSSGNSEMCDAVFTAKYLCELCGRLFKCILHAKQNRRQTILLKGPAENKLCVRALKNKDSQV